MNKNDDKSSSRPHSSGATALAEKRPPMKDSSGGDRNGGYADASQYGGQTQAPRQEGGGFFDIYKPSQGYNTRVWTGVSYGMMVCWLAYWLYEKFEIVGEGATTKYIQVGVAVATIIGFGLLGYWCLALNRKVCDFLIATEGEMKKVNWTSRKEIFGSTKVVIFVLVFMSVLLFVVDILFMVFFRTIGVLQTGGSIL